MTNLAQAPAPGVLTTTTRARPPFSRYSPAYDRVPSHNRIHAAFEDWARRTPSAVAVEHGDERITYGELDRRANCLASLLRIHHVVAGDLVGMFLHRSIAMVLGTLATLKLGAAAVPQDARNTPSPQLGQIISATQIRLVLTLARYVHRIPPGHGQVLIPLDCLALDALKYDGSIPHLSSPDSDGRTAVVIFSPGIRRNGVAVTHETLCDVLLTPPAGRCDGPGMLAAPRHDMKADPAVWETFRALSHGGTLVIRDRGDEDARAYVRH